MPSATRTTAPTRLLMAVALAAAFVLVVAGQAFAAQTFVPAFSFAGAGSDPGLLSPGRVAVEPSTGNVFVADSGNGRVQVFDSAGNYLTEFGAGVVGAPYGVAVRDVLGETVVYVSDPGSGKIVRFESDELLTPSFGVDGGFVSPLGGAAAGKVGSFRSPLAVDTSSGDLLVGDTGKEIVQRYDATGVFVGDFDGSGSPDGVFVGLEDLTVDSTGDVIVVDAAGRIEGSPSDVPDSEGVWHAPDGVSRVERFDSTGVHEATVGPVFRAATVTVNLATDDLYVSGNQDAVYRDQSPRLHVFDSSGAVLDNVSIGSNAYQSGVRGLAVNPAIPRVYAVTDFGYYEATAYGSPGIHALELATLPVASIDPVDSGGVTETTAEFSGTVDPESEDVRWRFEVSTDGSSWSAVDPDGDGDEGDGDGNPLTGTTPIAVLETATGLQHNTSYQVRLAAISTAGATGYSPVESFTTAAIDPPEVTLGAPVVDGASAELSATVDPNGFQTSYRFEYSTNGVDWTGIDPDQDGDEDAGNGDGPVEVTATLPGIEPSTTYQLRIVANNPGGETVAGGQSIDADGLAPGAVTHLIGDLQHDSARLTGFVDPQNQTTGYHFEWGTAPGDLDRSLPASEDVDAGNGGSQVIVGQPLSGLAPDTTYYYRLVATNQTGTTSGETRSFATRPTPPPVGQGVGASGDRGIELVNEPDKNGQRVAFGAYSIDGDRAMWFVYGGTPHSTYGVQGGGAQIAQRTPTGWKSRSATPPRADMASWEWGQVAAATDDLSKLVIQGSRVLGTTPAQLFTFDPWNGTTQPSTNLPTGVGTSPYNQVSGYSDDLEHLYYMPESAGNSTSMQIVDIGSGAREEVGFLPGDVSPPCGFDRRNIRGAFFDPIPDQNWVSADGERLFFQVEVDGECDLEPLQLFMREAGPSGSLAAGTGATTTLISGPPHSGPELGSKFIQATRDGSTVFFSSLTRLTVDDANDSRDIYRHRLGIGNDCLTCIVADAEVIDGRNMMSEAITRVVVSQDGSRVYFTSLRPLAEGALAGVENLYVLRVDKSEIEFISPSNGLQNNNSRTSVDSVASPDGSVLVFYSDRPELDALTGTEAAGTRQFYLYDDRRRSLVCASCPAEGPSVSTGLDTINGFFGNHQFNNTEGSVLSADGRSFVFATNTGLAGRDLNEAKDFYEWRDGRVGLLSDGSSAAAKDERPTGVVGITPDGSDVFFISAQSLVGGTDGVQQLYDARIGGGFPSTDVAVPCAGDDCQGSGSRDGGAGDPGSLSLRGSGDGAARLRPVFSVGRLSAAQRSALARGGTVALRVRVNRAGRVSVALRTRLGRRTVVVGRGSRLAARAGVVRVPLRLSGSARGRLAEGKRLSLALSVRFAGAGGPRTQSLNLSRKGR